MRLEQLDRKVAVLEQLAGISGRIADIQPQILSTLTPWQDQQLSLERVGSTFDGGYVIPKELVESASGVVSIGVGDNNDADMDLADRGLPVHAWDHTVNRLPRSHPLITFHRTGVGTTPSGKVRTIGSITEESFGHGMRDLILMMDTEGAEWGVLSTISDETLRRYSVLCLELHDLGDCLLPGTQIPEILSRLRERFVPVYLHPNNHGAFWRAGDFVLPDILEVTYVRRDLLSNSARTGNCPEGLVSPCCPDLPDLLLEWATPTTDKT